MVYSGVLAPAGANQQEFDALEWARRQASQSFGQGQSRLAPGQFLGGRLGQGATNMFLSPTGFDPAALDAMKSEAAQTIGGARAGQLSNLAAQAGSSGFSGGGMEARLASEIQAGGGRDLLSAVRELNWLNEQAKLQQSGIGAGVASNAMSAEAGMNQSSAQGYFNQTFPAYPGVGGSSGGGQFQYLNANGEIIPRQGWTQAEQEAAQRERQRWVQMKAQGLI